MHLLIHTCMPWRLLKTFTDLETPIKTNGILIMQVIIHEVSINRKSVVMSGFYYHYMYFWRFAVNL